MRITDLRVVSYDFGPNPHLVWDSTVAAGPRLDFSMVQVDTDAGLVGECPVGANRQIVEGSLKPLLLGEDPLLIEHLWQKMFTSRHTTTGGDFMAALGRVDIALWDLKGKILNQPVWKLLGGDRRRVEIYSGGNFYAERKGLRELIEETEGYLAMGYRAVKMKVGWRGISVDDDVERVRAVRETIGPWAKLMVDGNHAWRASEAIQFARRIERYEPFWFEEPVPHTDLRGGAEVCAALDMPVATGEMETSRWGFRDMIDARALDICQADPVNCGGLTEWRKIVALASAQHLPFAPHGTEHIGQHCVAALPEGLIVESYPGPYSRAHVIEPLRIADGYITLPDTPGLGLRIDREQLAKRTQR